MREPEVGYELLHAVARLSRWASHNASFEVPTAQARLLAVLEEVGPARVSDLAAADHSSQPSMSAQVQRLETAGWAQRTTDPVDARAFLISLTAAGAAALESLRQARLTAFEPVLAALDGPARERVRGAVDVLGELLETAAAVNPATLDRKD